METVRRLRALINTSFLIVNPRVVVSVNQNRTRRERTVSEVGGEGGNDGRVTEEQIN